MSTSQPASEADALAALEARLARLESKLDRVVDLMDQAMPHIAIGVDVADEAIAAAQARGVDVDARARKAVELVEQLTDPAVLDVLSRLAESAPAMAPLVDMAGATMPHIAMGVDILDESIAAAQARGVDVDERLRRLGGLVEKLSDPAVLDALERTVEHAGALSEGAEIAAGAPGLTAVAIDVMDEELRRLQDDGVDIDAAQKNGVELLVGLTRFLGGPEGRALLDSGLLDPHNAHRITQLSSAVLDTLNEEPDLIGPWGSFTRTWDKRFQRFAGFSFALAWRVGELLGPDKGRHALLHRKG